MPTSPHVCDGYIGASESLPPTRRFAWEPTSDSFCHLPAEPPHGFPVTFERKVIYMTNHTMCFTVVGQHISLTLPALAVSDTKLYLRASFSCDESWGDLVRFGVFTGLRTGVSSTAERATHAVYSVPLDEAGECPFPEEVLSSEFRAIRVGLIGYTPDGKTRLTTDICTVRQAGSCFYDGITPTPPAPDLYAEMLAAGHAAQSVIDRANAGGFDGVTPHIGENSNWFVGDRDTGVLARGSSGLVPFAGLPASVAGCRTLSANRMYRATLTGDETFAFAGAVSGYDNEWDLELTQGSTAYQIGLPVIRWGLGISPTFAANTTTVCRIYKVGDTLCGEWVSV